MPCSPTTNCSQQHRILTTTFPSQNGKCSKAEWQHLVEGVTDLAVPWDNPLWSNLCVKVQNAMSVGIHNNTASVSDTRRSFDTPRSSAWQGDSSGSPWESTPRPPMQYPESTDPFTPAVVPQHTVSGGRATSCASLDAPIGNLPGGSTSRDMAGRGSSFYSAFAGHPTPPPRVPSSPLAQAISNMVWCVCFCSQIVSNPCHTQQPHPHKNSAKPKKRSSAHGQPRCNPTAHCSHSS